MPSNHAGSSDELRTKTQTITIATNAIDVSKLNVRAKHSKSAIAEMAASIKSNGVINPPSVTANGNDRYNVVAGQLRVLGAVAASIGQIDVKLKEGMTDAELVEMSLAENVTRQEMGDLEQFVAFQKLAKEGRSVADIAASFSMTERQVRQSLAIGSLPAKIIKLAEDDKLYAGALEALTNATKDQLQQFLKMPSRNRPRAGWQIKDWLQKNNKRMPVQFALFDVADYKGVVTEDLFADESEAKCFTDADQFWKLQKQCIDVAIGNLKEAGWTVVLVDEWYGYDYKSVSKKNGGKAYVAVLKTGQVIITKGCLPHRSAGKSTTTAAKKSQPELTGPMQDYMRAHRHLAIQHALLDNHEIALALAVTLLISGDRQWNTTRESFQLIRNEKHASSIESSAYRKDCVDEYQGVADLFGISPNSQRYNLDANKILRTASDYDQDSLRMMLAALVSERLTLSYQGDDGTLDNLLGELLGLDDVDAWQPDDAFWSGIRSKDAMTEIVKEVAPKKELLELSKATVKELRELAKKFVAPIWRPAWLKFPAAAYTKKHGLPFVGKR